jgi:hypothetical protein
MTPAQAAKLLGTTEAHVRTLFARRLLRSYRGRTSAAWVEEYRAIRGVTRPRHPTPRSPGP